MFPEVVHHVLSRIYHRIDDDQIISVITVRVEVSPISTQRGSCHGYLFAAQHFSMQLIEMTKRALNIDVVVVEPDNGMSVLHCPVDSFVRAIGHG